MIEKLTCVGFQFYSHIFEMDSQFELNSQIQEIKVYSLHSHREHAWVEKQGSRQLVRLKQRNQGEIYI